MQAPLEAGTNIDFRSIKARKAEIETRLEPAEAGNLDLQFESFEDETKRAEAGQALAEAESLRGQLALLGVGGRGHAIGAKMHPGT